MFLIEFLNNVGDTVEEGDVLVISGRQRSLLKNQGYVLQPEIDLATKEYDTRVCGVVCSTKAEFTPPDTEGGAVAEAVTAETTNAAPASDADGQTQPPASGAAEGEGETSEGAEPEEDHTRIGRGQVGLMVVLGAFPHCKVDASYGAIKVGDLLTTSQTKGHARKVTDADKAAGAIVGKALGSLKEGTGVIPVLVTIQ
jgi:hypothetical protein